MESLKSDSSFSRIHGSRGNPDWGVGGGFVYEHHLAEKVEWGGSSVLLFVPDSPVPSLLSFTPSVPLGVSPNFLFQVLIDFGLTPFVPCVSKR